MHIGLKSRPWFISIDEYEAVILRSFYQHLDAEWLSLSKWIYEFWENEWPWPDLEILMVIPFGLTAYMADGQAPVVSDTMALVYQAIGLNLLPQTHWYLNNFKNVYSVHYESVFSFTVQTRCMYTTRHISHFTPTCFGITILSSGSTYQASNHL
jgi:hypothetical protein